MKSQKYTYLESLATTMPGSLDFYGSDTAELFTKEVSESLRGVLEKSFEYDPLKPDEKFVTTSVDGRVCSDHLWSRDAGTLMRELVQWGYLGHACYLADILLSLINVNEDGYHTFPMLFHRGEKVAGNELDGTGTVVIGFVLLWKRLEKSHAMKKRIHAFLTDESSPIRYILLKLKKEPLIAGSGEFGGGMFVAGEYYNVVQNYLVYLTLQAVKGLFRESEDIQLAESCDKAAKTILANIEKYLIDTENGGWIWCIDPKTMKPDETVLNSDANKGFGGINGVIAMYADVLGFELPGDQWIGVDAAEKSYEKLFADKLRREQFDKYGMWTQFDILISGLLTSPSYGQGYALQSSLMFDKNDKVDRLIDYLAKATYQPPAGYIVDRDSDYYFYERYLSPEFEELVGFDQGCGALNLVNVAEPLKVARMIAGIDDTSQNILKLIPRIPPSWKGYKATNWPILSNSRISTADIGFEKTDSGINFYFEIKSGDEIEKLELRLPEKSGKFTKYTFNNVTKLNIEFH
ncbi:MAG: hypothetical protein ACYCYI_11490 [Saccharofermentanales bacterium]